MVLITLCVIGGVALAVLIGFIIKTKPQNQDPPKKIPADCCGEHSVCMRDNLLSTTDEIVYFDDEELDMLAYRDPVDFSEKEIEVLGNVFYTLREQDVAGWLRSLQLRHITLPDEMREEALLIVSERRNRV